MFKYLTLALVLSANLSYSQKLGVAAEQLKLKYQSPAVFNANSPTHFSVEINEVILAADGSETAKNGILSSSTTYFWNKRLVKSMAGISPATFLDGVDAPAGSKVGKVVIKMGTPKYIESEAYSKTSTNTATGVTTTYWKSTVEYIIESSATFYDDKGVAFFTSDFTKQKACDIGKSNFPGQSGDFKSEGEANTAVNKNKFLALNRCGEVHLSSILMNFKFQVNAVEKDQSLKAEVLVHEMKGKGKGSEKYDDYLKIDARYNALIESIEKEIKSKSNMNWHTEAIQSEAKAILKETIAIVQKERMLDKEESLFDENTITHVYMNIAWLYNFTGKYEKAIELAELQKKELNKNGVKQIDGNWAAFSGDWTQVIKFGTSYPAVFEVGASVHGWK
jgi:hypothetical protein